MICSDDFDEPITCPICGSETTPETCWQCGGEGGFHDCGEDCCCCADPEEITDPCDECNGEGFYLACSALPHSHAQMERYRERQASETKKAGGSHSTGH